MILSFAAKHLDKGNKVFIPETQAKHLFHGRDAHSRHDDVPVSAEGWDSNAVDPNPRHSFGTETPDIFKDDEIIENLSARPLSSLATAFVTDEPDRHHVAGIDVKPRLNCWSSGESMVRTIGYLIGCDIISFQPCLTSN